MNDNKIKVSINFANCYNGGYSTPDGRWVHEIRITGHTIPHVCHGVSGALYMIAYGLKEKTNVQFDFSDVPGDSYMRLAKYNRDSELLTRTFIILVKEAIKKYPDTIVYEEYCLDGTDRKNL